jgi:hypothetical protein
MAKEGFYFPHFSNSRHDRKIKRVIKELGVEGYGIYFMTLEVLREQTDFKYPLCDIDLLADEFDTTFVKLEAVIKRYELFELDENQMFFSLKFIENMQPYLKMKEQRVLAGKASAQKRLQSFNDRSTTVQQSKVNKSKVNKSKVNKSKVNDLDSFIEFRNIEFDLLDETLKTKLKTTYKISAPKCFPTKSVPVFYLDLVDMLCNAIKDTEWQNNLVKRFGILKFEKSMADFYSTIITNYDFMAYNNENDFRGHYSNWLNKNKAKYEK